MNIYRTLEIQLKHRNIKALCNRCKNIHQKTPVTKDGEVAERSAYELNLNAIEEEARYDGFYAVCTNLDDDPAEIARINHDRLEIEESFRIVKTEFDA